MNIVGEGFAPEIIDQINTRQSIYGSINRDNKILSYLNNRTGWVRMVSSVDLDQNIRNLNLLNSNLAKKYVLFNGISDKLNNKIYEGIARGADTHNNGAYGVGGVEFGLRPMMGIISADIKTETRGSLKTATVKIKANNRIQFDIIDILYLRLGFTMLLEWGNSDYYENKNNLIPNTFSLENEFLNGKYNYDEILPIIQENRIKSKGNYDAVVGKVVNFDWTFNKDGTYDITVILRSLGDVIESLKINILLPEITPSTTTNNKGLSNEDKIIISSKDSHQIGKWFYEAQQKMQTQKTFEDGTSVLTNTTLEGNIIVDFIKQKYQVGTQYYIRFGHLLELIEKYIIPNVKNDKTKLIGFDTDIETNLLYLQNKQISIDPRICLFRCSYKTPIEIINFLQHAEIFYYTNNLLKSNYGKIMNCYFNMTFILTILDSLKDSKGTVSLYNFINKLCEGWNESTGYINQLEPTVDETTNKIKITDSVQLPERDNILRTLNISTEAANFNTFGYYNNGNNSTAGFIRDISFRTQVPSNLANMIIIGSTSNGYVIGQDATALSRMNNGLTDRTKPTIYTPQTPHTFMGRGSGNNPTELSKPIENKFRTGLHEFIVFIRTLGSRKDKLIPTWDIKAVDNYKSTANQFLEFNQASAIQYQTQTNLNAASPNVGFLPFDLTLTMDGLSGMKVYQKYTIDTSFLPSNYPTSLEFLIKGINNTIEGNQWITTIESVAIPKNPFGDEATANVESTERSKTRNSSFSGQTKVNWVPILQSPLNKVSISSLPSPNRTINGVTKPHYGIDIAAPINAAIVSPVNGVIANNGWNINGGGFGKHFVIIKDNNNNYHILGHNKSRANQKEGQFVTKGDIVAFVGNEGSGTGPHLHYEIKIGSLTGTNKDVVGFINATNPPPDAIIM